MTPLDDLGRRLQEALRGRFRVDRQIGKGGMATVYAGEDESLERPVAIKVLAGARLSEPGMLERFEREAKTVALLDHRNIVRVYTTEHADDLHAIVMEFIDGPTLDVFMGESGGVSVSRVLEWFGELASALDYAHSRGVIHRDLKPSNVMVRPDGSVVLTDFGIARFGEGDGLTRTGQVIGTPTYLSPEQWKEEELTAAADQYSCGVLLYELLSGAPPFTGRPVHVWIAHMERTPPPLLEARPDLPPELAEAIHQMLRKAPEARFPDLASAVRAARAEGPPGDAPRAAGSLVPSSSAAPRSSLTLPWSEAPSGSDPPPRSEPPPGAKAPSPSEGPPPSEDPPSSEVPPSSEAVSPWGGRPSPEVLPSAAAQPSSEAASPAPEWPAARSGWKKWKLPVAGIGALSVAATAALGLYMGPPMFGASDASGEAPQEGPPPAAVLPSRIAMPPLLAEAGPAERSVAEPERPPSEAQRNPPAAAALDGTALIEEPRTGGTRELSVRMSFAGLHEGEALCVVPLYEVGGASASPGPAVDARISRGSASFPVAAGVVAPLAGLSVTDLGGRLQVWRGACGSRAGADPDRTIPIQSACVRRFPSGQWHPCDQD